MYVLSLQKPLVAFKAGLVNTERVPGDATRLRMVSDPRKGEIRLTRNMDGTMELMWRDRSTGTAVHRFTVFPNDVGFKRIRTGRDADRVWELRFLAAGDARRFFFWMQSGKPEKDEENASKLLRMINDPAAAAAEASGGRAAGRAGRAGGGAAAGGAGALSRDELQAMLAAMVSGCAAALKFSAGWALQFSAHPHILAAASACLRRHMMPSSP